MLHKIWATYPTEGEVPLFENSDKELECLQYENACLEMQRKIGCLHTDVLGKSTH